MELVAGSLNKNFLESVTNQHIDDCSEVIAIVPYCDSLQLFEICKKADRPVRFYCRLDDTVPVKSNILRWFLDQKSLNYTCYVLRGVLHAKIIWFKGIGAYIGSANLTNRGWVSNIEAGLFITEEEMIEDDVFDELEDFLEAVHEASTELTPAILNLVIEIEKRRKDLAKDEYALSGWFDKNCGMTEKSILTKVRDRNEKLEFKKSEFLEEWNNTLQLLMVIAEKLDSYRPEWVDVSVPKGVHLDQFLHAYYFLKVREGNKQPYEKYYEINKINPENALKLAMEWWKSGKYEHSNEAEFIHTWAPSNSEMLKRDKLLTLSEKEFVELCCHVHAIGTYGYRQENKLLGLEEGNYDYWVRVQAFGRWLYKRKSKEGKSVLETIYYVLYGGNNNDLPLRLWNAVNVKDPRWRIKGFGISSLGELVGWAMPDQFPPRNNRTSKALKALGNNVKVHGENKL